jgi:hypothetical protein
MLGTVGIANHAVLTASFVLCARSALQNAEGARNLLCERSSFHNGYLRGKTALGSSLAKRQRTSCQLVDNGLRGELLRLDPPCGSTTIPK